MAIERQIGDVLMVGAGHAALDTTAGYIVEKVDEGGGNIKIQDIFDGQDGNRRTRIVMQRDAKVVLTLVCRTGATPTANFPEGNITTGLASTDLNGLYVDSCVIAKTEGAQRATVTLTNIGITTVT